VLRSSTHPTDYIVNLTSCKIRLRNIRYLTEYGGEIAKLVRLYFIGYTID